MLTKHDSSFGEDNVKIGIDVDKPSEVTLDVRFCPEIKNIETDN